MQRMADSLFERILLGGSLIVWGLLLIIFHRKLTEYRIKTLPTWLPWYIHGGAAGNLVFMVGMILIGIMLILLGTGVLYGLF
jgi:hypothetical protein